MKEQMETMRKGWKREVVIEGRNGEKAEGEYQKREEYKSENKKTKINRRQK